MGKVNGLHHLAISTSNIKKQIEFFSDVLGMELVALYWMHGVSGAWHGFLKLNDTCSVALVESPAIREISPEIGKTHSGNPGAPSAGGTMQHVAFNVDSDEELIVMRDRIRSRNVPVLGPIDHGFCKSIYFAGPEHLSLELSTSQEAINPEAWIDPEVVELAGISAEELARYKSPVEYQHEKGEVPQPLNSEGPHMVYAPEVYQKLVNTPDQVVLETMSETEPPVKVA